MLLQVCVLPSVNGGVAADCRDLLSVCAEKRVGNMVIEWDQLVFIRKTKLSKSFGL